MDPLKEFEHPQAFVFIVPCLHLYLNLSVSNNLALKIRFMLETWVVKQANCETITQTVCCKHHLTVLS